MRAKSLHDTDLGFAHEQVDGHKRVAVITGANAGLGRETARRLLLAGMRIICACRSAEKGKLAVQQLLEETKDRPDPTPNDALFLQLDVSSLGSVRCFTGEYESLGLPLHVLLCNAGIMMGPYRTSVDGLELQLATNYLGHFELCRRLTNRLVASAPSRFVHVSSIAAHRGDIPLDQLNCSPGDYDSRVVYSRTKLMQVVFSRSLNERLQGTGVTSHSVEPGIVATNLSKGITDNPVIQRRLEQGVSVQTGATTQVFACAAGQLTHRGGGHWANGKDISTDVAQWRQPATAHALRPAMNQALWDASVDLVNRYTPPQ